MNFFGHAAVASQFASARSRGFVLGAMLPDFLGMLRLKVPSTAPAEWEADVRLGYAFHQVTDHAFHELTSFQTLSRQAFSELQAIGLDRGPSRAVAHIGIELLIDETPQVKELGGSAYLSGLNYGRDHTLELCTGCSPVERERLEALLDLLATRGVRSEASSEHEMGERLRRVLAARPRLAFSEAQVLTVSAWVRQTRPKVSAVIAQLLAELWSALEALGYRRPPGEPSSGTHVGA